MKIGGNCAVTLRMRVSMTDGTVFDRGEQPLRYIHGGHDDIFAKIETALDGKQVGDELTVRLSAAEAFGLYDESLVEVVALDSFAKPPQVGEQVERGEGRKAELFRVVEIGDGTALLDGNHPLAGHDLDFAITVLEVRSATQDEVDTARRLVIGRVSRLRAFKMALISLIAAPVMLVVCVGVLADWIGSGVLSVLVLGIALVVLLGLLWNGVRYVREMIRGGIVLRLDVQGVYWRDFGAAVPWDHIARVKFGSMGEESWYEVTLADQRTFRMDASALSIDSERLSGMLANYLPAAKLEGF